MRRHVLLSLFPFLFLVATPCWGQYVVAHRGASHEAPENTLAAFRLAWEQQADAIEGDFYLTKDRQIVCIHDKTTKRTAPGQRELVVAESTLEELRTLDVGRWKDAKYEGEPIPTLTEVLDLVPAGKRIFVEIKCGPEILPVLQPQLEQSGLAPEQIVIICFNEDVVTTARVLMPQYKANWLTSYKQNEITRQWKPRPDGVLASLKRTGATGLGTKGEAKVVDAGFAKRVLEAGFELHIWTVNSAVEAKYFSALGAHSITTDKPALIRQSLQ